MGIHIIAEFRGVNPQKISRAENLRVILDRIITKSGLNVVSSTFHQFEPYGVTAVYLLRESHISVHTWPEHGYMALDIFTCSNATSAFKTFELFLDEFQPKKVEKHVIRRDVNGEIESQNTA